MANKVVLSKTEKYHDRNFKVSLNYWPDHRPRGFYVSVAMCEDNSPGGLKIYSLTNVRSQLVLQCNRYSDKQSREAELKVDETALSLSEEILKKSK